MCLQYCCLSKFAVLLYISQTSLPEVISGPSTTPHSTRPPVTSSSITSISEERPLIDYLVRFTIAIFNCRDRSSSALPGVLIAGVRFSVYPSTTIPGETVTEVLIVRATVEEDKFKENLQEELRRVRCHGSDRPLSDGELSCVRVEFTAGGNHGNNLVCICDSPREKDA